VPVHQLEHLPRPDRLRAQRRPLLRQGGETASAYNGSVLLGRSKDLGDTWETTIVRNARGKQGKEFEGNRPITGIAVDARNGNDDIVYVAWRREFANNLAPDLVPRQPIVSVSTDGGRTFGEPSRFVLSFMP